MSVSKQEFLTASSNASSSIATISRKLSSENINKNANQNDPISSSTISRIQKKIKGRLSNRDEEFEFEIHDTNLDSDFMFKVLGVERKKFSRILEVFLNNETYRNYLYQEIYDSYIAYEATDGREGLKPDKKWQKFTKNLLEARLELDNLTIKIRNVLPDQATKLLSLDELVDWLKSRNKNKDMKDLIAKKEKVAKAEKDRKNYCLELEAYQYYVQSFNKAVLRPGYRSAILYAKASGINLYIWEQDELKSQLKLIDSQEGEHPKHTVHLLCGGQYHYFSLLAKCDASKGLELSLLEQSIIASTDGAYIKTLTLLLGKQTYVDINSLDHRHKLEEHEIWEDLLRTRFGVLKETILNLIFFSRKNGVITLTDQNMIIEDLNNYFKLTDGYPNSKDAEINLPKIWQKLSSTENFPLPPEYFNSIKTTFEKKILENIRQSSDLLHFNEFEEFTIRGKLGQRLKNRKDDILKFPSKAPVSLQELLQDLLKSFDLVIKELDEASRDLLGLNSEAVSTKEHFSSQYKSELSVFLGRSEKLFDDPELSQVNGKVLKKWEWEIQEGVDLTMIRNREGKNLLEILGTLKTFKPDTNLSKLQEDCTRYLVKACLSGGHKLVLQEAFLWLYKKMEDPNIHINDRIFEVIFNTMKEYYENSSIYMIESNPSEFERDAYRKGNDYLNNVSFGQRLLNILRRKEKIKHLGDQATTTITISYFCNSMNADEALMALIYLMFQGETGLDTLFHPLKELIKYADRYFDSSKSGSSSYGFVYSMRYEYEKLKQTQEVATKLLEEERTLRQKEKIEAESKILKEQEARKKAEEESRELRKELEGFRSSSHSSYSSQSGSPIYSKGRIEVGDEEGISNSPSPSPSPSSVFPSFSGSS